MRGRPISYNNSDVIKNAQSIFWKKGYLGTSLSDLKEATQLGNGSFYNTFKGGKKELFRKSIQQRRKDFIEFKTQISQTENPLELIKAFFLNLADTSIEAHKSGCIVANSVTELASIDEDLAQEAVEILLDVEDMFTDVILHAQKHQIIKNNTNARVLGRYLITLWNGLNVTRRMHPDRALLKDLIKFQLSILS